MVDHLQKTMHLRQRRQDGSAATSMDPGNQGGGGGESGSSDSAPSRAPLTSDSGNNGGGGGGSASSSEAPAPSPSSSSQNNNNNNGNNGGGGGGGGGGSPSSSWTQPSASSTWSQNNNDNNNNGGGGQWTPSSSSAAPAWTSSSQDWNNNDNNNGGGWTSSSSNDWNNNNGGWTSSSTSNTWDNVAVVTSTSTITPSSSSSSSTSSLSSTSSTPSSSVSAGSSSSSASIQGGGSVFSNSDGADASSSSASSSHGGLGTGAIAGIVVAVLLAAALAGGAFAWFRKKRSTLAHDDHEPDMDEVAGWAGGLTGGFSRSASRVDDSNPGGGRGFFTSFRDDASTRTGGPGASPPRHGNPDALGTGQRGYDVYSSGHATHPPVSTAAGATAMLMPSVALPTESPDDDDASHYSADDRDGPHANPQRLSDVYSGYKRDASFNSRYSANLSKNQNNNNAVTGRDLYDDPFTANNIHDLLSPSSSYAIHQQNHQQNLQEYSHFPAPPGRAYSPQHSPVFDGTFPPSQNNDDLNGAQYSRENLVVSPSDPHRDLGRSRGAYSARSRMSYDEQLRDLYIPEY